MPGTELDRWIGKKLAARLSLEDRGPWNAVGALPSTPTPSAVALGGASNACPTPQAWALRRGIRLSLAAQLIPSTPSLLFRPFLPLLSQLHFSLGPFLLFQGFSPLVCAAGATPLLAADSPSLFTTIPWASLRAAAGPPPLGLSLAPRSLISFLHFLPSLCASVD